MSQTSTPASTSGTVSHLWLALFATMGAQMLCTFTHAMAPVMAPSVAPQLGLDAERVGLFAATAYLVAMVTGVTLSPWITWVGPMRVTRLLLVLAAGCAVLTTWGSVPALFAGAAVIGVCVGCASPAATAILGRHVPFERAGFFFSFKQAGVPLGVALAGLLVPLSLVLVGWRATVWCVAAVCLVFAFGLGRAVGALEWREREKPRDASPVSAFLRVLRDPALRRLSFVTVTYAMAQQAFLAYAVLWLVRLNVPLGLAAGLLAASQAASVVMRIGFGHVADHWVAPRPLLGMLGVLMGASVLALAFLPASPGTGLTTWVMVLAGATTMGWNGLFYAQIVRVVPREDLAQAAGGTQVFTFGGSMLGPYLMAELLAAGVGYSQAYLVFAALTAAAGAAMLMPGRAAKRGGVE